MASSTWRIEFWVRSFCGPLETWLRMSCSSIRPGVPIRFHLRLLNFSLAWAR